MKNNADAVFPENREAGGGEPLQFHDGKPLIGNARLAMLAFIAAEIMFFAGLIGAFLVFRFSGRPWPPPFLPRLPVEVTAANTVILLLSSVTMTRARGAIARGDQKQLFRGLALTALLGVVFLLIQGYEWLRLLRFGLTASSGVFGSTFYTIIGTHGLHVLGGVLWLLTVLYGAWQGHFTPERHARVQTCGMYWHLVVGLWPVLFFLVYLL
ncbi:MAG: heme-copper oxidase subunit III [bacterium]|nr:heme-copper oxidase subunit III [bacterium]